MIDRERLSRYLEGELAPDERLALETELAADPSAAKELAAMRRLLTTVAELPFAVEPTRDLWSGVAARIREDDAAFRRGAAARPDRRWLAAAAVLVVLGGSFAIGKLTPRSETSLVVVPAGAVRTDHAPAALPTEDEWAAASSDLFRALESSEGDLDPATGEIVRRNLEIIDEAVREIRAALDEDPQNAGLQKLLTAEYRRRSAVLRRAAQGAT